ncbi:hypothetical protein G5714_024512 [Onychostoma macrolepis]|uniref:Myb/SANT-like DNA-binding domain-containing protein n=1 Tax=Onychostoma macrolepis TaxID=369639 RepID=A0A7J6BKJ6_9TELE|nr:hypothetical protein G5714_024512 [Onychostoma macrolepis]
MDSRSCNFTAAETNALLEGVRCHYGTIVGSFNSAKDTNKKKNDVWILITENVNAIGSGQRRTTDQIKLRWKNLKARATKDHAEAKNPQTGNKPFKRGDYTDVVLDIIGGEKSQALHGIQGVVGDGEPWIEEEEENLPVPPEADPESIFIGIMKRHDGVLKAMRGRSLPLEVQTNWSSEQVLIAGEKKVNDFNQDMEEGPYVLLYPDCSEVKNIPGTNTF